MLYICPKLDLLMINYTIIIPHKNIPSLLQRCLNSIPRREDVQIVVVDDNSDADKVDFEKFPGLNDNHVEIIFGKNENNRKGAGYARNLGLEKAKGKWLIFADADDYFTDCFNEFLDLYKDDDENDVIFFKVDSINLDTGKQGNRHCYINDYLCKIQNSGDWDIALNLSVPWNKFIKREIVRNNNINFQEVQYANDVMFSLKVNGVTDRKKIDNNIIYIVTERTDSLVSSVTLESLLTRFNVFCDATNYVRKMGKKATFALASCIYWLKIWRISKKTAIKLLPKVIKTCDFSVFVIVMSKDYPKLERIYLWRKLKNKYT